MVIKKTHALKFQKVSTPNGLIANLYGPVEGRRHDCTMLQMPGLLETWDCWKCGRDFHSIPMENFCVLMETLPIPYVDICNHHSVEQDQLLNKTNSLSPRAHLESLWLFQYILGNLRFVDFKLNSYH